MLEILALLVVLVVFCWVAEDVLFPGRVPWAWRHPRSSCRRRPASCEACDPE